MGLASESVSVSSELAGVIRVAMAQSGGWLPFDRFMDLALYAPQLGYYANGSLKFGHMPSSGSDFVTAPEMSPFFGRVLAVQVRQALQASESDTVIEFGAGSGALAEQLLHELGDAVRHYKIVDVSGSLRQRQQERLAGHGSRVSWLDSLPPVIEGVVLGNEVLDAMPAQLLRFDGNEWLERGVEHQHAAFVWRDRPTALRPPVDASFVPGTITELHTQAHAWISTVGTQLRRGVIILIDYGFPEAEYYLPQRHGGTLMCHRAHRADSDPLVDVGLKDITVHVNFTGAALAAQAAGLDVLGYTSQARFLINCGMVSMLEGASIAERAMAQRLITEHEMGELFKVIAFARGCTLDPIGFVAGDRTHRL